MNKNAKISLLPTSLMLLLLKLTGCTTMTTPPNDAIDTQNIPPIAHTTSSAKKSTQKKIDRKIFLGTETIEARSSRRDLRTAKPLIPPDSSGYMAQGHASWYGVAEHGVKTASGQLYDLYGMTAAHVSLPLLTRVKVTNLRTGRNMIVTINDRLYGSNTLIKLSYWAARQLGLVKRSSLVKVRGLSSPISLHRK